MIQGFKQTAPLNEYERGTLLPLIIRGLRTKVGAASVISGSEIVRKMRECGYKLDGPRLRKIINHIRTSDIIPGPVLSPMHKVISWPPRPPRLTSA